MSRKSRKQMRLDLHRAGNVRCPICLTPFTEEDAEAGQTVTLEHVPPKAIGGSVMCLTCESCNAGAGGSLDQAVAMMNRAMTGAGVKVRANVFGTEHTTYFLSDDALRTRLDRLAASNPGARELQRQLDGQRLVLLTEMKRGPVWDASKGITISTIRPSRKEVEVSWLRSAYLTVFCQLGQGGYRYANSEAIRPIREQIMKPSERLVPPLLWEMPGLGTIRNLVVVSTHTPSCWIVKTGGQVVLLPQGGTAEHYKKVVALPDEMTVSRKGLIGWKPAKFGARFSFELSLPANSPLVGSDLFGREVTLSDGEQEWRFIVANQDALVSTFLPASRPRRSDLTT